jgi:hypothetical protein
MVRIATDSMSGLLIGLMGLPTVPASEIVAVTDPKICAAAREAYNSALPPAQRDPNRSLYVIRVGRVYSVDDPALRIGEFGLAMTLDERFEVIAKHTQ